MRLLALGLSVLFLTGCGRSAPSPATVSFQSQPAWPTIEAPRASSAQPDALAPNPQHPAANATFDERRDLALPEGLQGLIADLPGMARSLDEQAYQVQVVPRSSQEKADKLAKAWASDARQIYVIWAYWKLPLFSITRHAYYSPSKGVALKVESTLSSLFVKSVEEPAEDFDKASLVLNEARDRHPLDVKDAHAIARRAGYVPNRYGAAVLLDLKTYGPMWVFADMPTQTQGTPVMMVNAESGMVTQGGEAFALAKYLFKRAGY